MTETMEKSEEKPARATKRATPARKPKPKARVRARARRPAKPEKRTFVVLVKLTRTEHGRVMRAVGDLLRRGKHATMAGLLRDRGLRGMGGRS